MDQLNSCVQVISLLVFVFSFLTLDCLSVSCTGHVWFLFFCRSKYITKHEVCSKGFVLPRQHRQPGVFSAVISWIENFPEVLGVVFRFEVGARTQYFLDEPCIVLFSFSAQKRFHINKNKNRFLLIL